MVWCFLAFFIVLCGHLTAETPLLSSHAMSISMRAKEELASADEKAVFHAVTDLEELLRHPSFRRLEIPAQVQILFLLSKGYERVGMHEKQEKLLTEYAQRREFWRFHVPIMTALIRSYVQQGRTEEAETLLSKLVKPSCSHLSLEEKTEIASVLTWKDDQMAKTLRHADRLFVSGEWEKACQLYQNVLSSIEHFQFPTQASPVEKKKLRQKILFRLAESRFYLGDFETSLTLLTDWDDQLFAGETDEALSTRRLFLLGSVALKLGKQQLAETLLNQYKQSKLQKLPQLDTEADTLLLTNSSPLPVPTAIPTPQLLWHAQEAIRLNAPSLLQSTIEELQRRKGVSPSLVAVLEGHLAALQYDLVEASKKCSEGLPLVPAEWRQSALACLAQVYRQRIALLLMSDQELLAESLANEFLSKTASQLFQTWPDGRAGSAPLPHDELNPDPISLYEHARTLYSRALADDLEFDEAMSSLQELLANKSLLDVHPQLLSWMIELSLHYNQYSMAYELLSELMSGFPTYQQLPQTILSCIIAFEVSPDRDNERFTLCQYLLNRPVDPNSLFLAVHLFRSKRWIAADEETPLRLVEKALLAQEEGKISMVEITSSKEPALIKSRIETAKASYDTLRGHIIAACEAIPNPECQSFLWSIVFSSQQELLELLERITVSEYAFNELPQLLEQVATRLKEDMTAYSQKIPDWNRYVSSSLLSAGFRHAAIEKIYCHTFFREVDEALRCAQELSDERSAPFLRAALFLSKTLREAHRASQAEALIAPFQHEELCEKDPELALEVALEKSLVLRELHKPNQAMALLAWIINGPYVSSLRVKAMILRAEMYLSIHRTDLALRQLESVVAKGGEWAPVAQRKLQELYGTN